MNDESQKIWPESWCKELYSNCVVKISTNGKKLNQKQYLKFGKFPVIDQGQNEIGGYTDDSELIINCDFPVIVFGDHTRTVKSVKLPFAAGADGIKVIQPKKIIFPKLLEYFTQYLAISIKDKGYARHYQWVEKEFIGIPPEKEQHRIVAKIEELFSELDKGIESLKTAREQLKVYRQALLKHAFEGKLTKQWRKDNADKLETSDELLARIQQEREARHQLQLDEWEIVVAKWEEDGKEGKKPKKPRIYRDIDLLDEEEQASLPELPKVWKWVSLGELVSGLPRSMQSGPFGSNLKHSEFQKSGVLVLGIDNVRDGNYSDGSQNRISEEKFLELKKYQARPGDLLVTVMASLGRTCVVPRGMEKAIITKHVYRITMEQHLLRPEFFNLLLQSHTISRLRMFESAQGQTRPGLNSKILKELPIPLCSLEEQEEIFGLLDGKLSSLNRLDKEIENNIIRSEALCQSILKKAFSGQLVPQDPNDEPASELLKRIAAEKAKLEKKMLGKRTKHSKTRSKAC